MVKINRYYRNSSTISLNEQEALSNVSVLVIGLGGLGSHVIEALARIGFKKIGICDFDVIDSTNLNRQLLALEKNIGLSKAQLAYERIKEINSSIDVIVYQDKYPNKVISKYFSDYDLVFDCLDSIETRILLEQECIENNKKLVYGTIAGNYGYLGIIDKDNILIAQQMNITKSIEKSLGNPYYIVAVVAALQVKLALQVILNKEYHSRGFYSIDLDDLSIEYININ